MRVYKYHAPIEDDLAVRLPMGAQVLSTDAQGGEPFLWALVDPDGETELRRFHWRGTGHPADGLGRFVGTIQMLGGALVFHLFEAAT